MQSLSLSLHTKRHARIKTLSALQYAPSTIRRSNDFQLVHRVIRLYTSLLTTGPQFMVDERGAVGLDEWLAHVQCAVFEV
jgi:hypothetical protein